MLISKPTHGGGAPLGIDLEAGIAKIRIPSRAMAPAEPTTGPDDPGPGPGPGSATADPEPGETPATERPAT